MWHSHVGQGHNIIKHKVWECPTGEGKQAKDHAHEVQEVEPVFRFADFTCEHATNQGTYNQFQKLSTTHKQNYTKFAKNGTKEITNKSKSPQNPALSCMIGASQDYYINQSQTKLNKITQNYTDLVTFVTTHNFPEDQLQNFTDSVDFQNRAALKAHTAFMADIFKIAQNITSNEETNTPTNTDTPKYVNRQDLANHAHNLPKIVGMSRR